ncbi:hypothetical protein [Bdellovibrio sp. HCB209]|uniref:hypothetical protein n=1 Tax=Bdellovibrio sp. HCB209 TaxID=3394354 RepID=UPI0039B3E227
MRSSLFSSLKVVAMMLAVDKSLHPKEKKWFFQIAKNYGASIADRAELTEILEGKSTEILSKVISDIDDEFDRRRLLNFLQMAMRQDGIVKNTEIQLFYEIQKELETSLRNDYAQLGREIQKHNKEKRVWTELDRLGKIWSHKFPGFPFGGRIYYADSVMWTIIADLSGYHWGKILIGVITVIFIILIAARL